MSLERFEPEPNDDIRKFEQPIAKDFEPDWVTIGYTEDGKLIQHNVTTGEVRELTKWVETRSHIHQLTDL